ncbi:hypothetical protein, partial [Pseudomonas syringae group genomosp. 3]|uniref:hypothetical protein n=1 Tax=Pseudomonas syringae group genomosp. 3 TaxID=251701 RepID=UPI001C3F2238
DQLTTTRMRARLIIYPPSEFVMQPDHPVQQKGVAEESSEPIGLHLMAGYLQITPAQRHEWLATYMRGLSTEGDWTTNRQSRLFADAPSEAHDTQD